MQKIGLDIFCRLSTMHEHDRQIDRPLNGRSLSSDVAYGCKCNAVSRDSISNIRP